MGKITVAKNYLNKDECDALNRIVSMYLDYAERQANKGIIMHMNEWIDKLDAFLEFNDEAILKNSGHISHTVAKKLAETEFNKYKIEHDKTIESDFDRMIQ